MDTPSLKKPGRQKFVCVCVVKYIKHKLGHFNNFELHISGVLIMFSMCD